MKKLSFFLMAMLVSLTSFAAALGEGYEKVTDISTLAAGDKVVLYCDDAELGVTGWNGNKDATVAAEGWVEYVVEAADGGVLLKDGEQYVGLTAGKRFDYTATGSVCKVNAAGVLYITFEGADYLLYEQTNGDNKYYRMYVDKSSSTSYKPFYVYEVVAAVEEPVVTVPTNAELWEAFKPYYNTFYGEARADQPIDKVSTFMTKGEKLLTDETSEYKWLGDYLLKVTNEQIADGTLKTYTGITTEVKWRFATQAFFNCSAANDTDYSGNADFTEAGKPENWGPYYLAAQEKPEVTTVELAYELTNENVLDRLGRRTVYTTDDVLGDVQIILPTFNAETASYTDASLVVGDATLAATATYTADAENNKEVYTATATSEDGATVYNVTMTVTYPTTKEYTFFAMDDAEATVENQGEEGEPFLVYTVTGAGMLDEEPVEFELMIDQLNNIEGMIGEAFVMGTATSLYEEEGNLAVSGTAMDDAGNTYNIELWVPLAGGEVEIVITEEVDVTLYNLNLEVMGNMAMVTAGGETLSFWMTLLATENYYGFYFSESFSNIWYGDAQLQPYGDGQYTPDGLTVAFISTPDAEGKAVQYNFTLIAGDEPTAAQPALKGVVKRAVQLGESVVVLTHEEDGTAHIYNVVGENITEVSLEGVVPVDPENKGSYLAISDIAVTADGKLVANNYVRCQFAESDVETGYKRGTLTFYIWNDLAGAPVVWFQSMASSNSLKSDQGYTMAVVGTSTNADILVTGVHNTQRGVRMSHFSVVDGVFEDTQDGGKKEPYYYYIGSNFKGASAGADAAVFNEQTQGVNLQFLASPLVEENWIIDGELVDPIEFTNPQTHGGEVVKGATLTTDLGKKFNGATVLKEGEQVLMVAPYADADGKLAGVKVLDITKGLAADSVVATLDLDAPVEATAAATAVAVAAYDVNITLVADGYIYNLVYELPKPERTEETVLNPFAYDLSSTLSEDLATLTINYTLNANADAVEVVILSGEEVVKTIPCKGINKGTYTVEVPTAGLPQEGELTWAVNVKGTSVAAPTENPTNYSFYHPSAVDIDNNPENATFGMLLVNEAMQSVASKTDGYVSAGFGAGIFAFNPAFELITNGDKPGFNGGKTFSTETNMFAPRRIRISEDGRIFATAQDGSGEYLWEINPENLNEWTTVFQGTNDGYTLKDADGNFIAGTNSGFDVRGEGENLQLLMLSSSLPGAQVASFMCHTYDLGTATTWATAPTKEVPGANYMMVTNQSNAQFDKDGGVWYISYRSETTDAYPGLVHINKDGVEDLKVLRNYARNAGFRFNDDFTKVIIAGTTDGAVSPKKATVYAVSADENGVPVLTEELVIDMKTVGSNLNDFAWDYAGNLFACGNSSEKLVAWAMPYSGEVSTPAASKYAFTLAPEPVYAVVEDEITNLTSDIESLTLIGGPSTNYQVEVYLELGEENPTNATFALTENSSISVMGQDATFIEGYVAEVDIFTPAAKAVIKAEFGGQYFEFHLTMTGTPAEALEIVITDANVMVEEYEDFPGAPTKSYALTMTADWTNPADQVTYPVKVELPVYDPNVAEQLDAIATVFVGDMASENFLGFVDGAYLTVTTVEGVVTATGAISNPGTGFAANLTISGKLPQDPATGLDNINLNAQPVKMIKNGMLIIIKNGVEYNVQGAVVK